MRTYFSSLLVVVLYKEKLVDAFTKSIHSVPLLSSDSNTLYVREREQRSNILLARPANVR